MFDDIKDTVHNYIKLKNELKRVEAFLKQTLKLRIQKAKQEDILETIISLLHNQRSIEDLKVENAINISDAKFATGENI